MTARRASSVVGVDTGGTFTDLVLLDRGRLRVHKVPSTPADPARAIAAGLAEIAAGAGVDQVVHGTTVATNAVLEGKLARTVLVTNEGLEDVIEIGRQDRADLYDPFVTKPRPPVPSPLRFGVRGRIGARGERVEALDEWALERLVPRIVRSGARSIAVCFLHGYANDRHERRAARILARTGLPITLASALRPEIREYERTMTAALNAALVPVMSGYLANLAAAVAALCLDGGPRSLAAAPSHHDRALRTRGSAALQHVDRATSLAIMHSSGGRMTAERAAERPIETVLSGPAGGVAASRALGAALGVERLITFDMGGTSTDVSLLDGAPRIASSTTVAGLPVRMPVLDIHTVGAGGGSIARLDAAQALLVGPTSAGAMPGPACYGRGGREPTVTDADLVLGRVHASWVLGGRMKLDERAAAGAVDRLAKRAGLSRAAAAAGIAWVVETSMARAVRRVSVERGHDPADFVLLAFGGAGPVHAVPLARELGIRTVLVPPTPGIFSALGMAFADVAIDVSRSVLQHDLAPTSAQLRACVDELEAQVRRELAALGFASRAVRVEAAVDVRYAGQSHEISVGFARDFPRRFHIEHQRLHGHAHAERAIEIVTVRVRGVGAVERPAWPRAPSATAPVSTARIDGSRKRGAAPVYERARLAAGHRFAGPAIVVEETATTYLPRGARARVGKLGELWIEVGR